MGSCIVEYWFRMGWTELSSQGNVRMQFIPRNHTTIHGYWYMVDPSRESASAKDLAGLNFRSKIKWAQLLG